MPEGSVPGCSAQPESAAARRGGNWRGRKKTPPPSRSGGGLLCSWERQGTRHGPPAGSQLPRARVERFRGRGSGGPRQGRLRRDGAGVERTRTRGQSVGDGGALALRSARQEQHDGAGASPAGTAFASRPRALRFHSSPSGPSLAPRLYDAQEPAPGDKP